MPPELKVAGGESGLRIQHLRKSYRKKAVIRDFSMELDRGEVVALLGPNGSGKTTTFYAVAGLVTPEGGRVTVDGKDVTTLPMYRRAQLGIGYLPQEMSIFRGLSVQDNISAIPSNPCAARLRWPCRVGSVAGSKSPAVWPPIPTICCLTNPLPGSIRSLSETSGNWLPTLKNVASAC